MVAVTAGGTGGLYLRTRQPSVYTGSTEQPCCLCGGRDVVRRIAVPPRAVTLMENGDPIAWRDIVGTVGLYFCADDWAVVRDLALETGMHPLGRCNAGRADMDLRADFEALLNDTREPPDQTETEARLLAEARAVVADEGAGQYDERDRVEAQVVRLALADLGVTDEPTPAQDLDRDRDRDRSGSPDTDPDPQPGPGSGPGA